MIQKYFSKESVIFGKAITNKDKSVGFIYFDEIRLDLQSEGYFETDFFSLKPVSLAVQYLKTKLFISSIDYQTYYSKELIESVIKNFLEFYYGRSKKKDLHEFQLKARVFFKHKEPIVFVYEDIAIIVGYYDYKGDV